MTIEINKAGFMTTIQDGGRPGYAHMGIPGSGFMDQDAAKVANKMVGNADHAPLLEVDVAGIGLTIHVDCTVAVVGAQAQVLVNQQNKDTTECIELSQGDQLDIKPLTGGMWTYLAFAGGLVADEILGSCSTLPLARLGGHEGRRIQKGDKLRLISPATVKGHSKPKHKQRPHNTIHSLAANRGPEFDLFTAKAQQDITRQAFIMTKHISRQGMKITGSELLLKNKVDMNSCGLVPGSLQVTPGVEYIITHRDSQTTGGYPRIIVLARQSLNQLAQIRPGEKLYFYWV